MRLDTTCVSHSGDRAERDWLLVTLQISFKIKKKQKTCFGEMCLILVQRIKTGNLISSKQTKCKNKQRLYLTKFFNIVT